MNLPPAPEQVAVHSDLQSTLSTSLQGRWLWVAWAYLLGLTVLNLIIYIVGIPAYFAWFNSFHTTNCLDGCFTPTTVHELHTLGISITAYAHGMRNEREKPAESCECGSSSAFTCRSRSALRLACKMLASGRPKSRRLHPFLL